LPAGASDVKLWKERSAGTAPDTEGCNQTQLGGGAERQLVLVHVLERQAEPCQRTLVQVLVVVSS
jgi:hypothetical protein